MYIRRQTYSAYSVGVTAWMHILDLIMKGASPHHVCSYHWQQDVWARVSEHFIDIDFSLICLCYHDDIVDPY